MAQAVQCIVKAGNRLKVVRSMSIQFEGTVQ